MTFIVAIILVLNITLLSVCSLVLSLYKNKNNHTHHLQSIKESLLDRDRCPLINTLINYYSGYILKRNYVAGNTRMKYLL